MSCYNYKNSPHKRLSLLGMSGVGKTHLAKILRQTNDWFHYSGDYRIGSRYLNESILDNIKKVMMVDEFLRPLLMDDAIYVSNNITFDNLLPVSSFLGRLGNPELGALPLDEFVKRQALFAKAETNAMLDVPDFIDKACSIYGYKHFVNDAGGSLCELDESVIAELAKHSLIVYIKTHSNHEKILIKRAIMHLKPLYYQPDFLTTHLKQYLSNNALDYVAQINPDAFSAWLFPKLFYHRLPKYEQLAQKYGVTINSDDLHQCHSSEDFFQLLDAQF